MYFDLAEAPPLNLPPPPFVPVPPMPLIRVTNSRVAPYRFICRIVAHSYDKPGYSIGSGVLISPMHVLTCAHVIYPLEAPRTRSIVVYAAQNGPEEPGMQFPASGWAVSPAWQPNNCFAAGEDYGVIRLARPTSQGSMPLRHVDAARLHGFRVNLAGYPANRDRYARHMYESSGGLGGALPIARCVNGEPQGTTTRPIATNQLLVHELESWNSMSGGTMWLIDHSVQQRICENMGSE